MMWPSQNFLPYNGTIIKIKVNERINNYKNIYYVSSPPLGIRTTCTNYNNLISKKSNRFFIPVKYNHTCTKEVNLMPSTQFQFLFLLKMNKKSITMV